MLEKISEFVFNLGDEFKSVECVPRQIIQFSEKATIYTSSDFDQASLTLPGRIIEITSFIKPTIRIFRSIFSSILIESFLNIDQKYTSISLREHIYNKYEEYKNKFQNIIKEQNKKNDEKTFNSEYEIESFFTPQKYDETHYFSEINDFPDLKSILLNKKYWNIDITKVNSDEYNFNVSF